MNSAARDRLGRLVLCFALLLACCPARAEAPTIESFMGREVSLPEGWQDGIAARDVLQAIAGQLPLNVVAYLPPTSRPLVIRPKRTTLRHLLSGLTSALGSAAWRADGNTLLLPAPNGAGNPGPGSVIPWRREALSIAATLDEGQQARIRAEGYLPFAQLRPEQRERLRNWGALSRTPSLDDVPLIYLPDEDLALFCGAMLNVNIMPDPTLWQPMVVYGGEVSASAQPTRPLDRRKPGPSPSIEEVQKAIREGRPIPAAPKAPFEPRPVPGLATPPPLATAEDPVVALDPGPARAYPLAELADAIRLQHHRRVAVDGWMLRESIWIAHKHGDLTVDRLMRLMAQAMGAGCAWKEVNGTLTLSPEPPNTPERRAETDQIRDAADREMRPEIYRLAGLLWSEKMPPLPEACVSREPLPWKDVPAAWQEIIRQYLRNGGDHRADPQKLARFVWAPNGLDGCTVRFVPVFVTVVAAGRGGWWGTLEAAGSDKFGELRPPRGYRRSP